MRSLPSLRELRSTDAHRVGQKAARLGALLHEGFPVPEGFAVDTQFFYDYLDRVGLLDAAAAAEKNPAAARLLAERLPLTPIPEDLRQSIETTAVGFGAHTFAVRSSAIDEDGARRSFAGQHVTTLGVERDQLSDAILHCWASLYSDAALAYRFGHGGPPIAGMGVIIQRLVEPRCSGVLFTINAVNGSWHEMIVESTWGLGEPLVAGLVTPHWYLVRRPGRTLKILQRFISHAPLLLVQQDLPDIPERWVRGSSGVVREPVPAELQRQPTLDRDTLYRLCRLGLRLERLFSGPQDIEWALDDAGTLHLLQCRPITASASPEPSEVLWTRRFIGERWPEPATPLGWSMLAPIFDWFIAFPGTQKRFLGGGPPMKMHRSRPYINVTVFRHLAFKFPGAPAPRFMMELIPPEEEASWQLYFARWPGLRVYASLLQEAILEQRWTRFRLNPLTNHLRWEEFQARLRVEVPLLSQTPGSENDALRQLDAQLRLVRDYIGVHITSLLFANLFYQILESTLAMSAGERAPELLARLATCPPGNLTLAANEAMWQLARSATEEDLLALAQRQPLNPDFQRALDAFTAQYGHRSAASWEIFAPRWGDDPAQLAPMLSAQRKSNRVAPVQHAHRQQEDFDQAHRELKTLAPDRATRFLLDGLVHLTRQQLLLRENQRFWFDRLLHTIQRTAFALGDRLVQRAVLIRRDDVAFLTLDELRAVVDGTATATELRDRVTRRRHDRETDSHEEPPTFLRGGPPLSDVTNGLRVQGLGISPGRVRGKARVLRSPSEGWRLEPGDILVTRGIDPGWTPLFLQAGGVVLEMGSRLSHGAVVAREYRLPAVVNLDGITQRIVEGQEITVDGTRGAVWLHPVES